MDQHIERDIKKEYGRGVYISDKKIDDKEGAIYLGCSIPKVIEDKYKEETILKFIGLDDIGMIDVSFEENKFVVDWAERDLITNSAEYEMNNLLSRTEKAVLYSAKKNFSKSYLVKNSINPIIKILRLLFVEEGFSIKKIESEKRKYVDFLNNLNFLELDENKIYPGTEMEKYHLANRKIEETEKLHSILGEILEQGHSFLKTEMKINHLDPFIKITNANFFPSSLKREKLYFTPEDFNKSMKNLYGKRKSDSDIQNYLKELEEVDVFEVEGGYYFPTEDIWDSYQTNLDNVGFSF